MSEPDAVDNAKQRSLASRKFDFEDLINADPKCPLPALKIARAYLRYISDFEKDTAYVSLIDLQVATGMSTRAIIDNRKILEALNYFKEAGKTEKGVVRYKLQFTRENIVLDHMAVKRETLRRNDADRKEKQRLKRQSALAGAPVTEPDAVTQPDHVIEPGAGPDAPGTCTTRRDVTEPDAVNYLEEYLEEDSSEGERLALQTETPLENKYYTVSSDDRNLPFHVPENAGDVEAMLAEICAGLLPSVRVYFRNRYLAGDLTPAEVEQQRRLSA